MFKMLSSDRRTWRKTVFDYRVGEIHDGKHLQDAFSATC